MWKQFKSKVKMKMMQTVCRSQTDLNREILINISSEEWFYSAKQN